MMGRRSCSSTPKYFTPNQRIKRLTLWQSAEGYVKFFRRAPTKFNSRVCIKLATNRIFQRRLRRKQGMFRDLLPLVESAKHQPVIANQPQMQLRASDFRSLYFSTADKRFVEACTDNKGKARSTSLNNRRVRWKLIL